jgi:Xaa-Pro aminopeptidase
VVIGHDSPEPAIVHWSSWQSKWNRQEAVTSRVETPAVGIALQSLSAFARAAEIAQEFAGPRRCLGVERPGQTWLADELDYMRKEMAGYELVELGPEIDRMRSVKSAFEIQEIARTGRIMTEAMERFAQVARPGMLVWEATSAAEQVVKSQGCTWGRAKLSLDLAPPTIVAPVDRRLREDDIVILELDYSGPLGYWYEMSSLFTFRPLPPDLQAQLDAQTNVIQAAANACRTGMQPGQIAELTDQTWASQGYRVVGKSIADIHSIGLDESDGPNSSASAEELLETNMVVALHPGCILEGDRGFHLGDQYLITPEGGVRLSPKEWLHRVIEP